MKRRFSLYLMREILPLYIAGLVALLLLLLGVALLEVLADVIARGVSLGLVAKFLLYSLPAAAGYAIPLALLFAALLGITRLGQDSEIKAGLLLGLSPRQFAMPVIFLGLLVSAISFVNNEIIVPWSSQQVLSVQKDIFLQSPEMLLEAGQFFTDALGRSVYIGELAAGGEAKDITVIQASNTTEPSEVIHASEGQLDEIAGVWRLSEVRFHSYRNSRVVLQATASEATLPVRELSAGSAQAPELVRLPLRQLRLRLTKGRRGAEWTALHRKFAEPLAATAFAMFALAVGLYSFRSGFGLGFVSVLLLTFVYYATWSVANLLGEQGTIPAWLAGWTPVGLYGIAALILFGLSWRR